MMRTYRMTRGMGVLAGLLMALFLLISSGFGKHKKPVDVPPFLYQAGTENIQKGCGGRLEVRKEQFAFRCPDGMFEIPYAGITLMQYRRDLSPEVMAMKISWAYAPSLTRVSSNKYFIIISNEKGTLRAVVLRVDEKNMRPYFAEIELQSGKSVQEYRSYDEFQ